MKCGKEENKMSENKDNNDNKEIKEVTSKTLVDFKIPENLLNEQNQKKKTNIILWKKSLIINYINLKRILND